jgi:hypothetical protein
MKYTNATPNTRVSSKFQYYAEDCKCSYCDFFISRKRGCSLDVCCCDDIRADAIANGRIKRKRGWNRR